MKSADFAVFLKMASQVEWGDELPRFLRREDVWRIKPGNLIILDEAPFLVQEVYEYQQASKKGKPRDYRWREIKLKSLDGMGRTLFMELEVDDGEIYASISNGRSRESYEVDDDYLITSDGLEWELEESGHALFKRDDEVKPILFSYDEYYRDDVHGIAVEHWPDGDEVVRFEEVDASRVSAKL